MPPSPRRAGTLLLAVALLGACSSGHSAAPRAASSATSHTSATTAARNGSSTTAAPSAAPVQWVPCRGSAGPSNFQCATIPVPRDPQNPALGTIQLALDRRPASGTRIGSLLVNPGGPGASGVEFLPTVVTFMPANLLARFDVVSFDPPGVGRSAPIECLDPAGLERYFHADPAPTTPQGMQALIAEDRTFGQGCEQRSGAELPYVSTVDAAMDMDFIRRDLGDAKLTYLGFSYGTFLGATYAGLYPTRIRAMVLDGAIDPALGVLAGLDQQSAAIESNLNAALSNCTSNPSCPWKPAGDPIAVVEQLVSRSRTSPLPVPGSSRTVGPSELIYGLAAGLYSTTTWPLLDAALAQAGKGDGNGMLKLFDAYIGRQPNGTYTNEFEANAAVNCLDAASPPIAAIEADAPAAASAAPVFGVPDLYSELGCAVWPVPATGRPAPIAAPGSPPIVVVGSTGDPATPYQEAQALASELQHGVLLTRVGDGHTGYPYSACIRSAVDSYLIDLSVPAPGTRCPSD